METVDLKSHGLRDTAPRRLVITAFSDANTPLSAQEVHAHIRKRSRSVNLVTVYRTLETLRRAGLLHNHPCDGRFTLCSRPDAPGHHGFLHCTSCGNIEEFLSDDLCRVEDAIAKNSRFRPTDHVSEILGSCASCSR